MHQSCGDINEKGFLNNLLRKGFTYAKSLSEIHANSVDAKSEYILYTVLPSKIKVIDDGIGMDKLTLITAFTMYNSNHSNDHSIGVSGIGYKALLFILGNKKQTLTVTRTINGSYLTAVAPWDIICKCGKYTNMIDVRASTEEEIREFIEDRKNSTKLQGTTTIFEYNQQLHEAIEIQFECPSKNPDTSPEDRIAIAFGHFKQIVQYSHFEQEEPKNLIYYDYFDSMQPSFYRGIQKEKIIFLKKNDQTIFIWESSDGKQYEIKKHANGWSKDVKEVKTNYSSWEIFGEADIVCGQRRNVQYFDDDNPIMPGSGECRIHPYDIENVGNNFEFLSKMHIIRNDQLIGVVELPGAKISAGRANAKAMHKTYHVHCEFRYNPLSSIENEQDLIIGVQECKTQYICSMPINLLNLIKCIKEDAHNKIWGYFETKCPPPPAPLPPPSINGSNLQTEIHRVLSILNLDIEYTDKNMIELYELLQKIVSDI